MTSRNFPPLTRLGLVFLILASVARWLLHPTSVAGKDVADATIGLLYGLAIGCMLMGIWKARRTPQHPTPPPPSSS